MSRPGPPDPDWLLERIRAIVRALARIGEALDRADLDGALAAQRVAMGLFDATLRDLDRPPG